MLRVWDVVKHFESGDALRGVSLEVPAGQTTVLIGPSGCGKSTLLRLMVGLIQPDRGELRLDGEAITHENVLKVRQRIGYVIQEGGLFPHLTAQRNVALMARYLGWKRSEIDRRISELTELVRLSADLLERYPAELSGGQRQRVSLMRALMLDPQVLLLDEPLGALDPMIRFDLQNDLRRIFQRLGKTVVLVTHDIGEAGFFGDRIVLMREGQIVQQGSLEDLVHRPVDEFVVRFINAQRSPLESLEHA